jgi:hypothetical protein
MQAVRISEVPTILLIHIPVTLPGDTIFCPLAADLKRYLIIGKLWYLFESMSILFSKHLHNPENGGDTSLRNVGVLIPSYKALRPTRFYF